MEQPTLSKEKWEDLMRVLQDGGVFHDPEALENLKRDIRFPAPNKKSREVTRGTDR